jgi:hypothetical protein
MATAEYEPSYEKRMTLGHETRIGIADDGLESLRVTRNYGYFSIKDRCYEEICVEDADIPKLVVALGATCGEGCTGAGCTFCEASRA